MVLYISNGIHFCDFKILFVFFVSINFSRYFFIPDFSEICSVTKLQRVTFANFSKGPKLQINYIFSANLMNKS